MNLSSAPCPMALYTIKGRGRKGPKGSKGMYGVLSYLLEIADLCVAWRGLWSLLFYLSHLYMQRMIFIAIPSFSAYYYLTLQLLS